MFSQRWALLLLVSTITVCVFGNVGGEEHGFHDAEKEQEHIMDVKSEVTNQDETQGPEYTHVVADRDEVDKMKDEEEPDKEKQQQILEKTHNTKSNSSLSIINVDPITKQPPSDEWEWNHGSEHHRMSERDHWWQHRKWHQKRKQRRNWRRKQMMMRKYWRKHKFHKRGRYHKRHHFKHHRKYGKGRYGYRDYGKGYDRQRWRNNQRQEWSKKKERNYKDMDYNDKMTHDWYHKKGQKGHDHNYPHSLEESMHRNRWNDKHLSNDISVTQGQLALPSLLEKILFNGLSGHGHHDNHISHGIALLQDELHLESEPESLFLTGLLGHGDNHDMCHIPDVGGCSIEHGTPFFFKCLFKTAYKKHEICYHCGCQRGFTREECDHALLSTTWKACVNRYLQPNDSLSYSVPDITRRDLIVGVIDSLNSEYEYLIYQEYANFMRHFNPDINFRKQAKFHVKNIITTMMHMLKNKIMASFQSSSSSSSSSFSSSNDLYLTSYPYLDFSVSPNRARSYINHSHNTSDWFNYNPKDPNELVRKLNIHPQKLCTSILDRVERETGTSSSCLKLSCDEVLLLYCRLMSTAYFLTASNFGASSFFTIPDYYCGKPYVQNCLQAEILY